MAKKKDEIGTIWLYMAKRDKKGVYILARLKGRYQSRVKVTDIEVLNLPKNWEIEIKKIIKEDRMNWEPFVESADTFDDLKELLKKRGYTRLPVNGQALFPKKSVDITSPYVDVNRLPSSKTMIRRTDS